ncbi:MAG: S1/P1 nuclease [Chitinophagaceae bacterium]|nr:S1/P1 nuclease [Chitinophagaceae bacterium]
MLGLFYLPVNAMAWGILGHRIVGEIASLYLSPQAKKEIAAILGNETIAMSSNWADFIKSDTSFRYLDPWHYINLKPGLTRQQVKDYLRNDTGVDAYTRVNFLVKELKRKDLDRGKQLFYLRLLIHITGDLSQPMHTARPEDRGGNDIEVLWFNTPSNLHRVWDSQLIDYQQLSYTEYVKAINYPSKAQLNTWKQQPVSEWIIDSYQITEKLYAEIKQPAQKLGYEYNFHHVNTLNEQLLKGGVRLAGLLNRIFI